jgi:Mg2+ and Co2+ transporter CorA
MNFTRQRQEAAMQAALQRIKLAFRDAIDRSIDALTAGLDQSPSDAVREVSMATQSELSRKNSALAMAFAEAIDAALSTELTRRQPAAARDTETPVVSAWQTMALVDDREVELQVRGEAVASMIRLRSDAEGREVDRYVAGLLGQSENPESDRNPLRAAIVGKAVVTAAEAISTTRAMHASLVGQLEQAIAPTMAKVYTDIKDDLVGMGVEPVNLVVRTSRRGSEFGAFSDTASRSAERFGTGSGGGSGDGQSGHGGGNTGASGDAPAVQPATQATPVVAVPNGTVMGQVEHDVMALIRRLAVSGNQGMRDSSWSALEARVGGPSNTMQGAPGAYGGGDARHGLPNMIAAHREELRSATNSALDHMVIDVVGSLFDQILSDANVPPDMARHIARLQLPVLRAALGDKTFFSSRKHPVRLFVNRIASLAVAYDDFGDTQAQEFLRLVRELVDEIVAGDFDQIEPYEDKLDRLEAFIQAQAKQTMDANSEAGAMLNGREIDLLQHQRYTQQMHTAMLPVPMDDFLRNFLTQVWSQAIVHAHRVHGPDHDLTQRMRAAGRELVMSVQPKPSPIDRKNFLTRLPALMKDLGEGLAMIGWPGDAKKQFLAQLLPAHSASLKAEAGVRQLDYNLLAKQLDTIMATPVPKPGEAPMAGAPMPAVDDVITPVFTDEELRRIGLVREGAVDWSGAVDIDLSAGPEVTSADINIDGLPTSNDPMEPMQGASLAENLQIGFTYRMHFERAWHKVRLSHISPGRTFFVFTRGKEHSEPISMTARMLHRLCDTGRLRAYENAYLMERATARARKQLAAIGTPARNTMQ